MAHGFEGDAVYTLTPTASGRRLESVGRRRCLDPIPQLLEPLITAQAIEKGRMDSARLGAFAEARGAPCRGATCRPG